MTTEQGIQNIDTVSLKELRGRIYGALKTAYSHYVHDGSVTVMVEQALDPLTGKPIRIGHKVIINIQIIYDENAPPEHSRSAKQGAKSDGDAKR